MDAFPLADGVLPLSVWVFTYNVTKLSHAQSKGSSVTRAKHVICSKDNYWCHEFTHAISASHTQG